MPHLRNNPSPPASRAAQAPSAADGGRLQYVDGLRGIAMLMVLLFHGWESGGCWKVGFLVGRYPLNLAWLLSFGHVGVNLFLVLSGFCLYWPYRSGRTGRAEPNLWQYFKRRCRRILPPYYVALTLFAAVTFLQDSHAHVFHARFFASCLATHFAMLHNLRPEYVLRFNGVFWTQALEFQLYLLFPLLVEAYRRAPKGLVLLAVFLASSAYRVAVAHGNLLQEGEYVFVLAYSAFGRVFEFAFGMYIADLVARRHTQDRFTFGRVDIAVLCAIALGLALDGYFGHLSSLGDAFWGLLFGMLVLASSRPGTVLNRILCLRWLVWLGTISYSIYLVHGPFVKYLSLFAVGRHLANNTVVLFELLMVLPLVIGMSYLFHLLFERPFLSARAQSAPDRLRFAMPAAVPTTDK